MGTFLIVIGVIFAFIAFWAFVASMTEGGVMVLVFIVFAFLAAVCISGGNSINDNAKKADKSLPAAIAHTTAFNSIHYTTTS